MPCSMYGRRNLRQPQTSGWTVHKQVHGDGYSGMVANATAVVRVCDQLVAELCGETVKVSAQCCC